MCFCQTKTTADAASGEGIPLPLDPRPAFRWTRPGRFAPGPRQGGDFISPLTLDQRTFRPWTLDQGEPSCSPEPHDREAFRPWTPDAGGDFALPLDPHRAGLEGVPPSPAPNSPETVSPVDQDQGAALDLGRAAIGKECR